MDQSALGGESGDRRSEPPATASTDVAQSPSSRLEAVALAGYRSAKQSAPRPLYKPPPPPPPPPARGEREAPETPPPRPSPARGEGEAHENPPPRPPPARGEGGGRLVSTGRRRFHQAAPRTVGATPAARRTTRRTATGPRRAHSQSQSRSCRCSRRSSG